MKESNVQKLVQFRATDLDILTFRNNSGQYKSDSGHVIRYGVGNPGGSDLIGICPVEITADMVGSTIGVFTAIEVKTKTGRVSAYQKQFIDTIISNGGIAGVCRLPGDVDELKNKYLDKIKKVDK